MPYFVTKKGEVDGCSGFAVVKADGEVIGCHTTKGSAIDQMVAISINEGIEPGGTYIEQKRDTSIDIEERAAVGTIKIGDFVTFTDRKQDKYGEVQDVLEQGTVAVPGSAVQLHGSVVDPVTLIQVYEQVNGQWQETGEFVAKHVSAIQSAQRQSRSVEPHAYIEARAINLKPPAYMRAAARQGLRYVEQGEGGDGLKDATIREARAMAQGNVTADKWVRIRAWIARHLVDLDSPSARPSSPDYPSAGVVAHLLWGSGPSKAAAKRALAYAESVVGRIESQNEGRAKGMALSKIETRVNISELEIRETDSGMTFEGYAAIFNSPSEPLPFTETIAPGAFRHSLKRARNDIKLLWNHDTGSVLGSTRAGTLRLVEDNRGLRVSADLPNTSLGRDTRELIRRGDIDSMSFGFSVPSGGDEWSTDGSQRTLKSVRLHEVSIVAFPAYPETAGTTSVRGLDSIAKRADVDADAVADALLKIETGDEITAEEAEMLRKIIDEVSPQAETVEEVVEAPAETDVAMLELKRKKLELLLKGI